MTIDELLASYELFAMNDVEKGERFERLMRNFMLTYPAWRGKISEAWLWKDFPFRHDLGTIDLGIDLVAKTVDGEFWAAQCKFYADTTIIAKPAVDSFFSEATRTFGDGQSFAKFIWISTTDRYTDNAREMFKGRKPAVQIIDLATLRRVQINWALLDNGFKSDDARIIRHLRDYQQKAVDDAQAHYQKHARGRLIMACGTGKTFTSLKIAEALAPDGLILFLVPSISLLSQTLEEWAADSAEPLNAVCVCSDETAAQDADEITDVNLPLDATTDPDKISDALNNLRGNGLTVVFSTYQSLDKVAATKNVFDLIICDEAHRTTGSSKDTATQFTAVHSDDFIKARRRLYMTATPRMFTSDALKKAAANDINVWSMDDEKTYGDEFYRLNFGQAVKLKLLSDYKVIVLTLNEKKSDDQKSADANSKISGTINALAKKMTHASAALATVDPAPMHTAVAFCPTIKDSKAIAAAFDAIAKSKRDILDVKAAHVDGTQDSRFRNQQLSWLKTTPADGNACRILTNVRCLSEGVDVPALDAVIFMASKKSKVEIVQAVGRVMRKAPDKKYGYIIIPVVVPLEKNPEDELANSKAYNVIWDVLNALRSHDGRIDVFIEEIKLQLARGEKPNDNGDGGHVFFGGVDDEDEDQPYQLTLHFGEWQDFLYARMVERVGNRRYWEQWAADIAQIAQRHTDRIKELIAFDNDARRKFYNFVYDLQQNLNPAVMPEAAVEMLAQHIITRPVFEALFENYSFVEKNPVSQALEKVLAAFDTQDTDDEAARLKSFADSVRERCQAVHTAQDRQQVIIELYEKFFQIAVPKTVERLGIVYTPVEVVDFILRSVDAVLKKNFKRTLSDKGVHVLDPFAGTGTFLVRLIQSGLIKPRDLFRKYLNELHANEIVLLAYYIAAVNVENAYHAAVDAKGYQPFEGICFTDTFQAAENDEHAQGQTDFKALRDPLHENAARVKEQLQTRIEVIIGNPPYSVGQRSANDNNQNQSYQKLEDRIAATYAAKTDATNKNALYDSYIKAFRWASDRISGGGVIGFVTNAGWLDGAAMDGLRKCFANEFSEIYVFNLRGNARTQGEQRQREKGNVFGSGSRAPIAVTVLVKKGTRDSGLGTSSDENTTSPVPSPQSLIFYRDIGDYLTREQKLDIIARTPDVLSDDFKPLTPNDKADWINQRGNRFETFIPLHDSQNPKYGNLFNLRSRGLETGRDAWIYNFSREKLLENVQTTIEFYNSHESTEIDPKKISWTRELKNDKNRGLEIDFDAKKIVESLYRPFCKTNLYYDEYLVNYPGQMPKFFPTGRENNLLICVSGLGGKKELSTIITDKILDLNALHSGTQCYPLYWYEAAAQGGLFGENLQRRDGISDFILNRAQNLFGDVTREDIFYYVYGFLHLPSYRARFGAELKKSLPRIILVDDADKFWTLSRAGRELAEIHLNYERQPAPDGVEVIGTERGHFAVTKLKLSKDKTTLTYNGDIKIRNIPPRSFEYVVNGRSPLEWIIDRYQVKTDKASGIINDANAWGLEHDNPRYILDLILSSLTVSLKTLDIVDGLPSVDFGGREFL